MVGKQFIRNILLQRIRAIPEDPPHLAVQKVAEAGKYIAGLRIVRQYTADQFIVLFCKGGFGACYVDAVTKVFPEIEELWLIARREDRLKAVASKRPDKRCVVIPMDPSDMNGYEAFTIIQLF